MNTKYYSSRFWGIVKRLRTKLPCQVTVKTVSKKDLKGDWARCWLYVNKNAKKSKRKYSFVIEIERGINEDFAIDILVHEWGHAYDQHHNGYPRIHHRKSWSDAYNECYTIVYGRH